jgi:hypothetical protein
MHNRAKIAWWYLRNMPMDELTPKLIYDEPSVLGAELLDTRQQRSYPCVIRLPPQQRIKSRVEQAVHVVLSVRRSDLARLNYVQEWPAPPDFDRARINVTLASAARTLRGYGVDCNITFDPAGVFSLATVTADFRTGQRLRMAMAESNFLSNRREPYAWLEQYVVDCVLNAVRSNPRAFVTLNPLPTISPQLLHFSAV